MSTAIRFLVVRRPGVYNTHSNVIQPMEHTLVNDGLPLLFRQFKSNITNWSKVYLPHCKSIHFEDISLQDADHYITDPERLKNDFDGASILLNHPKQHQLSCLNLKQLYVPISAQQWHLTPSTVNYFGGSDKISTCLDHAHSTIHHQVSNPWIQCNTQELIDQSDITIRNTFAKYAQYITYLRKNECNRELILFHSNHLSVPLAHQIKNVIKQWQPDQLLLESDAIRMENYVSTMRANYLSPSALLYGLTDIGVATNAAKKNIATHMVLSDWNIAQYRIMARIARYLDTMQSKDAIDRSSGITLHVIGQLFCPSLLPKIQKEILNEHYSNTLKVNHPHSHWMYQKRNDIFANTINNCHGNKVMAVFGHAHMHEITNRLKGNKKWSAPFRTIGSHNIQF